MPNNILYANFDSTSKTNELIENIYINLNEFKSGHIYNPKINNNKELVNICTIIILLDLLNKLSNVPKDVQNIWTELIKNCQAEESGYFGLNSVGNFNDNTEQAANLDINKFQSTCICLQALNALGSKAKYEIRFLDKISNIDSVRVFIDELEKGNSYIGSEWLKLILFFLIYRFEAQENNNSALLYYEILDYLDLIHNKETGFWGNPENSKKILICTTFNLLQFYDYVYRPIKYPTQLIESVFEHITFDSLIINPRENQPYCDLSSTYILSALQKQRNYRKNDIKDVLINSYSSLKELLHSWSNSNSIQDAIDEEIFKESNLACYNNKYYNLLLRSFALAILEKSEDIFDRDNAWKLTTWPGMCYLQNDNTVGNDGRECLRNWIKIHRFKELESVKHYSKNPLISVVIPCYNLGLYLRIAIESVLSQTFNDLEIIVVNDGSTDRFTNYVLQNIDYPKTNIINQENQGLAASRNNGIKQANGKYICCLDADDSIRPYYFEKAYPILEKDSNIGFVSGYVQGYDEWNQVFGGKAECNFPQLIVNNGVIVTALFRKESWEKVGGYYEEFTTSGIEDWDFWISILESGYGSYFIPEIFYDYRIRSGSMARHMTNTKYWEKVSREIVSRHIQTYVNHIEDYVALKSDEWSVLLEGYYERQHAINWWKTQSFKWKDLSEHNNKMIKEQESWIKEQESRIKEQESWIREQESRIKEQESWIRELEIWNKYNLVKYFYKIKKYFQKK